MRQKIVEFFCFKNVLLLSTLKKSHKICKITDIFGKFYIFFCPLFSYSLLGAAEGALPEYASVLLDGKSIAASAKGGKEAKNRKMLELVAA